jgi:DNA-directed RNA polymerase specialized sigma24 family protein
MSGQWLEIVAKEHKYYVDVVRSFGEYNFAEDIVQEMYLRIYKYTSPDKIVKDGQVNKGFIWFVLRNIYVDYCKQRSKIVKTDINDAILMSDEQNTEAMNELYDKIEKEIESWHWYDTMLFKLYRDSGKSMRELEAETKISLTSIFHTIKHCKARINAAISEDYYDVLNN